MKILLLTDTHGKIDRINQLAEEYHADACIHCGDVGFFDRNGIREMPVEELTKMIRFSHLAPEEKIKVNALSQMEKAEFILRHGLAGNFEDYLNGTKKFNIPVYAVWGNHEDVRLVEQLQKKPVHNLTLLNEKTSVMLEQVRIYGLGGDFNEKHLTMSKKMGIPRIRNQIKSTFWQYHELVNTLDEYPEDEVRIQITHCDPGEAPFLEALAHRCHASMTLSGHMHRKNTLQWNSNNHAEAIFRHYAEMYPALSWGDMLKCSGAGSVRHLNLAPSEPHVLEIKGSEYQICG